jgi:hypothetical protein
VQKIEYNRKKDTIKEDEIYQKDGKKWTWDNSASSVSTENATVSTSAVPSNSSNSTVAPTAPEEEPARNASRSDAGGEIEENLGKFTPRENEENLEEKNEEFSKIEATTNLALNSLPAFIPETGRVLGASDIRETDNQYLFTPTIEQKHWAKNLTENFWQVINSSINSLLLKLF